MGNNHSDLTEAEFKQQWKVKEQVNGLTTWENKKYPQLKVVQYNIRDDPIETNQKLAHLRRTSPFIAKAYTLKKEGFSCQIDHDAKKLFVQHIILTLSNLKDIPYPDIFHLYDVCIHGYKQLTEIVGYFGVDEVQIGINEAGQARAWLSGQFESNKISGGKVTQSKMVSDILEMLRQVADHDSCGKIPNIYWYIGNHENITFAEVKHKFQQYIRTYCEGWIPTYLNCVNETGSNQIESWCRNNQSNGFTAANSRQTEQFNQYNSGGGIITNIAPGNAYTNQISNQPIPVSNSTFVSQPVSTQVYNQPTVTTYVNSAPVEENRVVQSFQSVQPTLASTARISAVPQATGINETTSSFAKPINPTFNSGFAVPKTNFAFTNGPTTSVNLVRTPSQNISTQNLAQFNQRSATLDSTAKFISNNNVVVPPPQVIQQAPAEITQKPLFVQNITQLPPQYFPTAPRQVSSQPSASFSQQPVALGSATSAVSQAPIPTYNQPLQVVESISFNQTREYDRLQPQRVISQAIELKDGGKVVETGTKYNSTSNNYQTNGLIGSLTEDYTKKQLSNANNNLSNFGRSVPYSFDVAPDKKVQNQYDTNKFTPESDGKSSPEFLALLSQIKSGIGQTNSFSDNYSNSPSKYDGAGSYGAGSAFQEAKFTSSNYVTNKYQGGLDPEIHADLQKYKQ